MTSNKPIRNENHRNLVEALYIGYEYIAEQTAQGCLRYIKMTLEYRAARQTWKGWANFFKMILRIRACAVREVAPLTKWGGGVLIREGRWPREKIGGGQRISDSS